ncbi:hypothetical protein FJZ19_04315 [Candidatus Pacearchaeota archaeon]|nr:hypothetical protein [Candidatus Pacearchaeota archaeon]
MLKKRWLFICIFILIFNIVWLIIYNHPASIVTPFIIIKNFIFASVTSVGKIFITISGGFEVNIHSPVNTTYNFNIGDSYLLSLNVSSNRQISDWQYTLEDLRHNKIVYDRILFIPNITIDVVRWSNKLTVYANDTYNFQGNNSVIFYVNVPNSAPVMQIGEGTHICEGKYFLYVFNVTDVDENSVSPSLSSYNPFFVSNQNSINLTFSNFEIFSGVLQKKDIGVYYENVSVDDGQYADNRMFNISVLAINNIPVVENIGVQTIWVSGENNLFYKQLSVQDTEDGNQNSGNLTFNISISGRQIFNISRNATMLFSPTSGDLGIYNIIICASDLGASYPNLTECGQDERNLSSCINFSLTITDANRAPQILSYYPLNLGLNINSTDYLNFNATYYDPDLTIPDLYWYVDDVLKNYVSGSNSAWFNWSFGCGVSGNHTIRAVATDGNLSTFIQWNLSINLVSCPQQPTPFVGGEGGGKAPCKPKPGCENWQTCQNTKRSSISISKEDFEFIEASCSLNMYDERFCGFQIRKCYDLNYCNITGNRSEEIRVCYYTEEPNCNDGITNCHDGACEILADCGGSCKPCPTCSDKIKNQNEDGTDCGGPCPVKCPVEKPLVQKPFMLMYILIGLILLILLVIIIIRISRIIKYKREISSFWR